MTETTSPVPVRVICNVSMPRLAFTDNMLTVAQLLTMNIPIRKAGGAYWEQAISRLLYKAVEEEFDYALIIDYDSMFSAIDVHYLLRLMASQPDAAAIFSLQYRRGIDQVLCSLPDYPEGEAPATALGGHLQQAKVGNFGLTLIRISALKQLPHPWFWSQPNAEGKWEAGKVDADIYFWNKMFAHELKVYIAPRLVIGHAQLMITWPDGNMMPRHQYIQDYFENGDLPDDIKSAAMERTMASLKDAAE